MKLYKLVEQDYTTFNGSMKWEIGKTNKVKKCKKPTLCSSSVIHAYKDKNLALIMNPIHAKIENPIMLECEGEIVVEDWDKCGIFKLTPIKKLRHPRWYNGDKKNDVLIMFAVLCAESVLKYYENYSPDDDRPYKAIRAAKIYLECKSAANAAAYANASDASDAADAAAAGNAAAAYAAYAAYAAARAANAAAYAAYAAYAAAYAANAASYADNIINFALLAKKAIKDII